MYPKIGVLMLDIDITRPHGDIGNPGTFPFLVQYKKIKGASIQRVVHDGDPRLIDPFIKGIKEMQGQGVKAVTTSCGFLSLFQKEISLQVEIPFYSSSLMQIPLVHSIVGGPIGVLTATKSSLTRKHFEAVCAAHIPVFVEGMEAMPAFRNAILEESSKYNSQTIEREMVMQALTLKQNHPEIKAYVFECTNMPPYRESVKKATGLPVFDIVTLTKYVYESLP
ncbi:aspartate/glutamate racemase family protein [Ammoniphilus sp. CFH 90114]|uniref:aspartate/glutamate racemase family protein n=1 Tax=Ammoniphilus sp. CFH 90114 TaxID=2493665 RepID=UPI00100DD52E|nr:aspartate/glutamate racemase family protein [Ammoniphilus sp. CFH 90114]RXT06509.1 aspartate/glutamate racemase family protein [Ammoniphilus sp. CFH 90114]